MNPTTMEILATTLFAIAIVHTFCVHLFRELAERFPEGSAGENFFHLLGEVEVVFGLWAGVLIAVMWGLAGGAYTIEFLNRLHFTEPIFVFVIMSVASTRPVLSTIALTIEFVSRLIPLPGAIAFYLVALICGPLLGSLITEPAAMTVTALILLERFYSQGISSRFMYATLGLLFVNISIGGTLTHYAAPPVLMVAGPWQWDTAFMFEQFGWRAALACVLSTSLTALVFRKELAKITWRKETLKFPMPLWVIALHLLFLAGIVVGAHHTVIFLGLFLFFLGLYQVTLEYQEGIKLKEGMLVGYFLAGLVVLGALQSWWLEPVLQGMSSTALFWGAMGLTAITDNAALTYLGTKVPSLSDLSKIALVSGAVVGGGLTVIANAPNPAGFGILNPAFKGAGINAGKMLLGALVPTLIAAICFWII